MSLKVALFSFTKKLECLLEIVASPNLVFSGTDDLINFLYSNNYIQDEEITAKIEKILKNVNESEKKLIKMNFFEGKSHNIISKDLEIPLGTVKSRLRNILNKMKNL